MRVCVALWGCAHEALPLQGHRCVGVCQWGMGADLHSFANCASRLQAWGVSCTMGGVRPVGRVAARCCT